MKRILVESSCVASMGYNPNTQTLEIEFRQSGDIYRYFEVLPEEHASFTAANSKGTYLNEIFKPKEYRYIIVRPGTREVA